MSCKTSLTELVFDEWKWERRKRFHSFIAQKTRSLSKRLRPIVLWNATRSIFVSLFKILSKKRALFGKSYLLFNNVRNICFDIFNISFWIFPLVHVSSRIGYVTIRYNITWWLKQANLEKNANKITGDWNTIIYIYFYINLKRLFTRTFFRKKENKKIEQ